MWSLLIGVIGLLTVAGTIFYEGMQYGEKSCEATHAKMEAKRIEAINKRVDEIKITSEDIGIVQNQNIKKISDSLDEVIARIKGIPTPKIPKPIVNNNYTTIQDCKPSDTYVETFNEITKKANSK